MRLLDDYDKWTEAHGLSLTIDGQSVDPARFYFDPASGYFSADGPLELADGLHQAVEAKEGVPMLYPGGGYDDREKGVAYGMEKSMEYNRDHYHRVSDEYDLSWNVEGAMEDMEAFFRTGLEVANDDAWPNWRTKSRS